MADRDWDELARDLESIADDLDGIAQDAGALTGELPVTPDYQGPVGKFDPRFSQVKGAQFVSGLVSLGGEVRRRSESIEEVG